MIAREIEAKLIFADVVFWLQTDLKSPELEVCIAPERRHSRDRHRLPGLTHYGHLMVGGLLRLQSGRPAKLVHSGSYISCDGRVLRWPSPRRRKGGENRQAAAIG